MLKVLTVVGTRPEIIKMSRLIAELDSQTQHILVHTGQNYDFELNEIFFNDLSIRKPDYFLDAAGENAAQTIGRVIEKVDYVLQREKPDAMVVYGDTNSCLSVIAGKRRQVPIFHLEAGNRCFDQRVPEELNRKIVDHLSDINFVLSEHARRYLIAEGVRPENIIKTGSNMDEVIGFFRPKILNSTILEKQGLKKHSFFIASIHREENVDSDEQLSKLVKALNSVAEHYGLPVILSTHPRTRKRLNGLEHLTFSPLVKLMKPFGFFDYMKLQTCAKCVISDSGTLTEEASFLNFPAVMVRNTHERPEGMDAGVVVMSGLNAKDVLRCVSLVIDHQEKFPNFDRTVKDYSNVSASTQVCRTIHSYVNYVNETVWRKPLYK